MVIFGPSVFYLFGSLGIFSAAQFPIFSALWIRPYGPVRFRRYGSARDFHAILLQKLLLRLQKMPKFPNLLTLSSEHREQPQRPHIAIYFSFLYSNFQLIS